MNVEASRLTPALVGVRTEKYSGKIFLCGDAVALIFAFLLATVVTDVIRSAIFDSNPGDFYDEYLTNRSLQFYLLASGLCLWFALKGHYSSRHPFSADARHILVGIVVVAAIDGYLQFALKDQPSRIWLSATWLFAFPLVLSARFGLKHLLFRWGPWRCPTLLVGSQRAIEDVAKVVGNDPYLGHVVTGRLRVDDSGDLVARLDQAVRDGSCRYILVAFDETNVRATHDAVRHIEENFDVQLGVVPSLRDICIADLDLHTFFGHDLLVLSNRRRSQRRLKLRFKRIFDVVGAGLLLLCLAPLLLIAALLVTLDGGAAIYGSRRIGRDGRVFRALKFRSMVPNAAAALDELLASDEALRLEWQSNFKLEHDPRVTRIGRFLRRTSIDELPQLINVLKGEMSLVGPRPLLLDERAQYTGRAFDLYSQVTPGLTGMWQVSGRDDLEYYRRIELNNWYIKNWSAWVDLIILVKTCFVVVRGSGAS